MSLVYNNQMIKSIPEVAQKEIERYMKLQIGGKEVRCPYYINLKRAKDLRAMVGKGTPEEIEIEAQVWAKMKGIELEELNANKIREFLMNRGIGIDCSGFVIHVLNKWYKKETGRNIWRKMDIPNKMILARIAYLLKPVEKLGAEIITNSQNSQSVKIKDVLPGDVIRTKWKKKNSHHILLITKVEYGKKGEPKHIEYTHSIPFYDKNSGVKTGGIKIKDLKKPLEKQDWEEKDENGVNHVLEGYMIQLSDNGLRRINTMKEIQRELES